MTPCKLDVFCVNSVQNYHHIADDDKILSEFERELITIFFLKVDLFTSKSLVYAEISAKLSDLTSQSVPLKKLVFTYFFHSFRLRIFFSVVNEVGGYLQLTLIAVFP